MKSSFRVALATVVLAASVAGAQQRRGWEIGFDAGLFRTSFEGSDAATTFEFPVRALRAGFPIGRTAEFEPVLNIARTSSNGATATSYAFDLALVANLTPDRRTAQWFLRPFIGYQETSLDEFVRSRTSFGIGGGVRVGVTDRVSMRYEARYRYFPERRGISGDEIGLLGGISIFTR
ncbi:MAG TPA: outer membrane beta-barrel protein [Gemmatimonadaceae bacterium]